VIARKKHNHTGTNLSYQGLHARFCSVFQDLLAAKRYGMLACLHIRDADKDIPPLGIF
jgi:hypothetical protein